MEELAQPFKLSQKQKKFLCLLDDGYSAPWDWPEGSPILNNREIKSLRDAGLIKYDGDRDGWVPVRPSGNASKFESPWSD